ncbi:MAG: inositol monophosphatase family protein [Solirubrobacterales bacterium]
MEPEIDWLDACRRMAARQADLFARTRSIAERTEYEGRGEGGDMTLKLDRQCEDIVFEELERIAAAGLPLAAVSEERGEVRLGAGDPLQRVVIDPIDGSMNVRRTIPSHSLSVAVADGDSMADVHFGFVHDFGAAEEFSASRGAGARLGEVRIESPRPGMPLEVVGLESADPRWILGSIDDLQGKTYRVRAIGSIAISLAYVACGRFDAMLSARGCRSVDAAAAQLIVREAGSAIAFVGCDLDAASLDLDARYPVAAARLADQLEVVLAAQEAGAARQAG